MATYGSYHITVKAVLIFNGTFLLVKRSNREGKAVQNLWELPGGGVDIGEAPRDAILREICEEIGVVPFDLRPSVVWHVKRKDGEIVGITYTCRVSSPVIKLSEEHIDYAWVSPDDIEDYNLIGNLRDDLEKVFKQFEF